MKFILFATSLTIVKSFTIVSLPTCKEYQKLTSHDAVVRNQISFLRSSSSSSSMRSDEELFEAEEAALYDASDISDSGVEAAVMERAVMLAYDMMKKKKLELKEKVQDARAAEQQYVMMEQATKDFVKQYKEDPTKFKETHSSGNGAQVAIEMLESVIADAAQKMIDLENNQDLIISQFYEALEEEEIAEANAALSTMEEEEAKKRIFFIEEFNDDYEVQERRRDMAVSHAAHDNAMNQEEIAEKLSDEKVELFEEKMKVDRQIAEHRRNEDILKADLREFQQFVRDELLKEWEQQKQEQKMM